MPPARHVEQHFTANDRVRDVVIGMADGLTVPFALAAGMSGAVDQSWLIVAAGLAEIAAGSIAMGLGGFLAARTDAEHYRNERARERREITDVPEVEAEEVAGILRRFGLTREQANQIVAGLRRDPERWLDFMMRFELGLDPPDPSRAWKSAATIAGAYIVGGLVPLTPYILVPGVRPALLVSVAATLVALAAFGAIKAHFTGLRPLRGALQTVLTGGLAAAAAFGIATLVA